MKIKDPLNTNIISKPNQFLILITLFILIFSNVSLVGQITIFNDLNSNNRYEINFVDSSFKYFEYNQCILSKTGNGYLSISNNKLSFTFDTMIENVKDDIIAKTNSDNDSIEIRILVKNNNSKNVPANVFFYNKHNKVLNGFVSDTNDFTVFRTNINNQFKYLNVYYVGFRTKTIKLVNHYNYEIILFLDEKINYIQNETRSYNISKTSGNKIIRFKRNKDHEIFVNNTKKIK